MEETLQKIALTGGKAAWSYAASIALRKITSFVNTDETELNLDDQKIHQELLLLDKKLARKLTIANPIIDSCELQLAQGNMMFESILKLTDDFKQSLMALSLNMYKNQPFENLKAIKNVVDELDELIPLLQLTLQTRNIQTQGSNVVLSRLLEASSYLVKGDYKLANQNTDTKKGHDYIQIGPAFPIRLYSLFEGSVRKSTVDWTWKEDYSKANVTIQRHVATRTYLIRITECFNDGRYHDSDSERVRDIFVSSVRKMFYTTSGKLLNIQESLLPVLVFKITSTMREERVSQSDASQGVSRGIHSDDLETGTKGVPSGIHSDDFETGTQGASSGINPTFAPSTPRAEIGNTEWLAMELFRDDYVDGDDTESISSLDSDIPEIQTLQIASSKTEQKQIREPSGTKPSLSYLCLLEYMLRLCFLESRENKSHTIVSNQTISQYFENTSVVKQPDFFVSNQESVPQKAVVSREPMLMKRFLAG